MKLIHVLTAGWLMGATAVEFARVVRGANETLRAAFLPIHEPGRVSTRPRDFISGLDCSRRK
jgi:hypothetical protein